MGKFKDDQKVHTCNLVPSFEIAFFGGGWGRASFGMHLLAIQIRSHSIYLTLKSMKGSDYGTGLHILGKN